MRQILALLFCLAAGSLFAGEWDRVRVVHDRKNLVTRAVVNTSNGNVALSDVFRAAARMNGYDDAEIHGALPEMRVSLDGRFARWSMRAFNRVMKPCVRVEAGNNGLQVTVDRVSAQQWVNDCKSDIRWTWDQIDWRDEKPEYGIRCLGTGDDNADFVVLVHGLNSRPEDLRAFLPVVKSASLAPAVFRYPNDQPAFESAKLLADELSRLRRKYPHRNVRLVTHSMGGLVARAAIETDLDPGNVSQLLMVAPPNHGSSLARVAALMDCYEFFTSPDHRRAGLLVESVSDGLGEAAADLEPNSVFLDRLNGLPRNPDVRYTILLGTSGPMELEEMDSLRQTVRDYTDQNRWTRFASSKLNTALDNLDEVVAGKGDGAVSCERGKLAGVRDIVELPFSHASILSPDDAVSKSAYAIIHDRLVR